MGLALGTISFLLFVAWSHLFSYALGAEAKYIFGPKGSRIWFDADAVIHTFQGEAKKFRGSIGLKDSEDVTTAEVTVEVEAASLETGVSLRDKIMRNSQLEVERHPIFVLRLDRITRKGPGQSPGSLALEASGELLIHGVKRAISTTFEASRDKDTIKATGSFAIKMSDFKISRPSFLFFKVKDEVKVSYEIVAERVKERN